MRHSNAAQALVRQFQSETDALKEASDPILARSAVFVLAALIASLFALTFFARIDRVVSSEGGKIVPVDAPLVFGALDASIIKTIDVKVGDEVKAGQLLATLDPTFAAADVGQLKQQIASLEAQIARATAEQKKEPLAFAGLSFAEASAPYIALQRSLYEQRAASYAAQLNSFSEKIAEAQATIQKYEQNISRYKQREQIAQQIEDMRVELARTGAGSKLNMLLSSDQRLEAARTLEFDNNSLLEARHTLSSLTADRDAYVQQWFAAVSQEIVTARNSLDAARSQLAKAAKHQDLVRLVAPEPAMVLSLAKVSVGSVLKDGEDLVTLMPLRTAVDAEVRIASKDVGFIRPNDPCVLKIDAFNVAEHGTAEGRVRWISADTFTSDDDGKPTDAYYKVRISIEKMNFTGVPANFRLIPGMTLAADIKIGTRSVFAYLVGGAMRGAGEAMREP